MGGRAEVHYFIIIFLLFTFIILSVVEPYEYLFKLT